MKKKIFCIIFAGVITFALVFGIFMIFPKESKELADISYHADMYEYSYEELKEDSQIIALIEVMDELTEKNSEELISQGYSIGSIGRRQVKVLTYFKNEKNYGDILTILEPASIINNQYIHPEDYEKLKKGKEYFVFLSDDTASEELSLMSACNGTFKMDNFNSNNRYFNLAVKSIIEYMTDLTEEQKEEIIRAAQIVKTEKVEDADIETEVMGIKNEMELNLEISKNGKIKVQIVE